jgi:nucleotide-binding universal stress UspA family protein
MRISRILWAADKSKESGQALKWAEFLANRFGARVIALSVIESPGVDTVKVPADLKKKISRIDRESGTREAKRLKRVQYILKRKGVDAATEVVSGSPYREIIKGSATTALQVAIFLRNPRQQCHTEHTFRSHLFTGV